MAISKGCFTANTASSLQTREVLKNSHCFINQKQTAAFFELEGSSQKAKSFTCCPLMICENIVSFVSTNDNNGTKHNESSKLTTCVRLMKTAVDWKARKRPKDEHQQVAGKQWRQERKWGRATHPHLLKWSNDHMQGSVLSLISPEKRVKRNKCLLNGV